MLPQLTPVLTPEQHSELEDVYHSTRDVRVRTRAQMVFLAAEQRLSAVEIAAIVRESEATVRRWVVERTLAWLSKCRALLVRYDKHAANFRALLQFACALLWFRRLHRLSVLR